MVDPLRKERGGFYFVVLIQSMVSKGGEMGERYPQSPRLRQR